VTDLFDQIEARAKTDAEACRNSRENEREEREAQELDEAWGAWARVQDACSLLVPGDVSEDEFFEQSGRDILELSRFLDERGWQDHLQDCNASIKSIGEECDSESDWDRQRTLRPSLS
jgi:hypothetical protein